MTKILAVIVIAASMAGCVTKNPNYDASQPSSASANAQYVADTNAVAKFQRGISTAESLVTASAPVDPYAGDINMLLAAVAGAVGVGSGVYAKLRSTLAAHKKATQTLANVVASAGGSGTLAALANAPDGATAAIIATHLNDAPLATAKVVPPA